MNTRTQRFLPGGLVMAAVLCFAGPTPVPQAAAQDKPAPKQDKPQAEPGPDYREYFKKPTNLGEFWSALEFEMEVGRYDLAAAHLRGLLNLKPGDADLAKLGDDKGIAAFLKLRNVPRWSEDPKADKQAKQDVEDLITRITAAVKAVRGDPKRIQMFIGNLLATPEENAYALKELYRSGATVVPYLIDAIRKARPEERPILVNALARLGPDTLPPLLAALDSNDPGLTVDVIDVVERRAATQAVPDLWYLSASRTQPDEVRQKATETLAYFLRTPASKLPPAKAALAREAERYYRHQVKFPDSQGVVVWRWDGKGVVAGWPGVPAIPVSRAEEYYGLKYAGQALALDPGYEPAQVVWLSLSLEKAQQEVGLAQPLDKAAPAVHAMLASVGPELVNAVLERGLRDGRTAVILGAVRDLGARDEVRGVRAGGRGEAPLVRALQYPDRRVQFAAAEALLRIPGAASTGATTRVVEVLRRTLAADPGAPVGVKPKVIVGYFDEDQANRAAAAVASAGFEPVKVRTGRAVVQRLGQAADIDLILMDEALPDPGLANLLGQLRADVHAARLPVVLTVKAEPALEERAPARKTTKAMDLWNSMQFEIDGGRLDKAAVLLERLLDYRTPDAELVKLVEEKGLAAFGALRDIRWSDLPKENERIRKEAEALVARVTAAVRQPPPPPLPGREDSLRRFLARSPNVTVVSEVILEDPKSIRNLIQLRIADPGQPALSAAEMKDYAERSVVLLARLARGEPPGFDVRLAGAAILDALRSPSRLRPEGQRAAAEAASRLPGSEAQMVLADVVLDGKRPLAVRVGAAEQLIRHIQTYSPLLSRAHVKGLAALNADPALDPPLKAQVALAMGSLQPDARLTGQRLLQYRPPVPAAPAPPPPPKK
jgi:CheY-like chemotaxis protein